MALADGEDGGSLPRAAITIDTVRESGLSAVAAAVCALLVGLVWLKFVQAQRRRKLLPPGPRPWPILGNFPALARGLPYRYLQQLAFKYGGLMYLRLGSMPCIVVSTAAVAKEIFQHNDAVFSSRRTTLNSEVTYGRKSMGTAPYGPYWRQTRKVYSQELFSPRRQASYESSKLEEIRHMMKNLLNECKQGNDVNLKSWSTGVTANIMTRMLMNKRFFESDLENTKEKEEFDLMVDVTFANAGTFIISDYVPYLSFITKLQGWQKTFEETRDLKDRVGKKICDIEGHKERAKERGNNNKDYVPDFVDVLLTSSFDDGQPPSDNLVFILLNEALTAGIETSATTTQWAMSELILNPHLIKQAQEELDVVVGVDRLVQDSDIPKLPYLRAIVKETFRLHPPAPFSVPRESTQPSQVMGYNLPAQTILIFNLFAIHRDPDVYENPNMFNPDRFMKHPEVDHTAMYNYYQLMPFGAGRRMCPGYQLGDMLVHLMVANLLHSFDWGLPKGENVESFDMSEVMSLVVSRKNPLYLVAKPRLSDAHLA